MTQNHVNVTVQFHFKVYEPTLEHSRFKVFAPMTYMQLGCGLIGTHRRCGGASHQARTWRQDCDNSERHLKAGGRIDGVAQTLKKSDGVWGCLEGRTNRDPGKDRIPFPSHLDFLIEVNEGRWGLQGNHSSRITQELCRLGYKAVKAGRWHGISGTHRLPFSTHGENIFRLCVSWSRHPMLDTKCKL